MNCRDCINNYVCPVSQRSREDAKLEINQEHVQTNSDFIMYAILLERTNSATGVCNKFREVPGLIGTIVSNMYELKGLDGQMGQYFMFPDLSVNREGQYHLRFCLLKMDENMIRYCTDVVSDSFQVYSPRNFPGVSESTLLCKLFSRQGTAIRLRKVAKRKRNSRNCQNSGNDNDLSLGNDNDLPLAPPLPEKNICPPLPPALPEDDKTDENSTNFDGEKSNSQLKSSLIDDHNSCPSIATENSELKNTPNVTCPKCGYYYESCSYVNDDTSQHRFTTSPSINSIETKYNSGNFLNVQSLLVTTTKPKKKVLRPMDLTGLSCEFTNCDQNSYL